MPLSRRTAPPTPHGDGSPTTLFHSTTRPRPLLVLDRRESTRFEMVIDLRDDDRVDRAHEREPDHDRDHDPDPFDRPLMVLEWGDEGSPAVVIDLR